MNTDYNLYKIFLYLFEEKSISKTANKLYVSQPAISYSLKELENQLGYTLFYRNSKGIEPTIEAKELYGYISTAFNILEDAEERLKNLNNLKTGSIRIGITSHIEFFYLSKYILNFRKLFPGIKFEFVHKSSSDMVEMLEMRNLDIIIDIMPITNKKNISKLSLSKVHTCFCYNREILKDIKIKKIEDLLKYPLILPSSSSFIRQKFDEYMIEKNIKLDPVLESDTPEMMLDMIHNGMGVGYLIEGSVLNNDNISIVSFDNKLPTFDVSCFFINDFLTTASKKFIETLKNDK